MYAKTLCRLALTCLLFVTLLAGPAAAYDSRDADEDPDQNWGSAWGPQKPPLHTHRQQMRESVVWIGAVVVIAGLLAGAAKLIYDMRSGRSEPRRPKQPWEMR